MCYLGWIANIFLILSLWLAGSHWRYAFALTAIGEALWVIKVWRMTERHWDMLFICVSFTVLAIRNLILWSSP